MPPRDTQPFAGQSQTGQSPTFLHDEAGDLVIREFGDIHSPDFSQYTYGDAYPGLVATDGTGTTLYGSFVLTEWQPLRYPLAAKQWQALPGSWVYQKTIDKTTGATITVARRKNIAANITPGLSISSGSVVETKREDIDTCIAWEIVETTGVSPYNSFASAIVSSRDGSFPFPGRLDIALLQSTGLAELALVRPKSTRVTITTYTYWVASATKPAAPAYDQILTQPQITVTGITDYTVLGNYNNVLIDENSQTYNKVSGGTATVHYNASTPSFSDYNASWLLAVKKPIAPTVSPTKNPFLWMIEEYTITML
jgi:hypothetical protein